MPARATVEQAIGSDPPADPLGGAERIEHALHHWPTAAAAAGAVLDGVARHARALATAHDGDVAHVHHARLIAALVLGDHNGVGDALGGLDRSLAASSWPDGGHRVDGIPEHRAAVRRWLGTVENARRFDLVLPVRFSERVDAACSFLLHVLAPDPRTGLLDGHEDLALAAAVLDRPDLRFGATAGRDGAAPGTRNVSFPYVGAHVQRTGWGGGERRFADESRLLLDASTLGASVSTRAGEMLLMPAAPAGDGALVERTSRWTVDVIAAAAGGRRREVGLLRDARFVVVDHGTGADDVRLLVPGAAAAIAPMRDTWLVRADAADIVVAGSGRPVVTGGADGATVDLPRSGRDAITILIRSAGSGVPHGAPATLGIRTAVPTTFDATIDGRVVSWRLPR